MEGLKQLLLNERERLQFIMKEAEDQLKKVPSGRLRISVSGGNVRFYHLDKDQKKDKYIRKTNNPLIRQLAQKGYCESIVKISKKRLMQIDKMLVDYDENEIENAYKSQHPIRQQLVIPIEPIWEEQLGDWINTKYEGKAFQNGAVEIYTEKGERVRSKSEKIIADYLYRNNIPYKYECPLQLKGYGIVYPDFTLLSPRTRKEIYWEHEGRMDDPLYARSAVKKIQTYLRNGICLGENLILTFETEQTVLNTDIIECLVNKHLRKIN